MEDYLRTHLRILPTQKNTMFASLFKNMLIQQPGFSYEVLTPSYEKFVQLDPTKGLEIKQRLIPALHRAWFKVPGFEPKTVEFDVVMDEVAILDLSLELTKAERAALRLHDKPLRVSLSRRSKDAEHFWIGHVESDAKLGELLSEDAYWALDEDEQEDADLSLFATSQSTWWYDHDFLEAGWSDKGGPMASRFARYSWAHEWGPALDKKAQELGIVAPNCFIMFGIDKSSPHPRFNKPASIQYPGIDLHYVGIIEFEHW